MYCDHQCPRCLKFFSSKQSFESHFQLQINCHLKHKKVICPICFKGFSRKFYLKKHLETHQNKQSNTQFPIKLKLKSSLTQPELEQDVSFAEITSETGLSMIGGASPHNPPAVLNLIGVGGLTGVSPLSMKLLAEQNQKIIQLIEKQTLEQKKIVEQIGALALKLGGTP